jgi:predicted transcriptional regulator with HTH domain
MYRNQSKTECQWLKLVILATQEAEIRRIIVGSQPRQIVQKTLYQKYPTQKWVDKVAQVVECLPSKCEALSTVKKKKNPNEFLKPTYKT